MSQKEILGNYLQIKKDIQILLQTEMKRMLDTPELMEMIIRRIEEG